MGDMGEVFSAMSAAKKLRHLNWKTRNTAVLVASGENFEITNNGETLLFRLGRAKADFYPSTGRWRSEGRTYKGGATSFLNWWAKRKESARGEFVQA